VSNTFTFTGLEELREALRTLPAELAGEGGADVTAAAQAAEAEIREEYDAHRHSGNLARGLSVQVTANPFGALARVKNTAFHAWIFENGTQARHWKGGKSTGAMWGATAQPPKHVFVRTVMKRRKQMFEQLRALLERQGLEVTGEP
jgi:hypothetical protein